MQQRLQYHNSTNAETLESTKITTTRGALGQVMRITMFLLTLYICSIIVDAVAFLFVFLLTDSFIFPHQVGVPCSFQLHSRYFLVSSLCSLMLYVSLSIGFTITSLLLCVYLFISFLYNIHSTKQNEALKYIDKTILM